MLKPFLLVFAVVALVIAAAPASVFAAGAPPQAASSTNPVKPTGAALDKAKKLYGMDCAICHGDNGNGKTDLATSMNVVLSDMSDPKTLADKPDQEIFDTIRKGKGDKMPAEDVGRAKDADVWGLVLYLRGLPKNQPAAPAPTAAPADAAPAPAAPASTAPASPNR
jgi:mono/diheme cytochrome c family protein